MTCVLLILPKLVLSLPSDVHNTRQREKHIRKQLDLATRGQWQTLYDLALSRTLAVGGQSETWVDEDDEPLPTKSQVAKLIRRAMQGEPIKGWKEFTSPGLAPPDSRNFAKVLEKIRGPQKGVPNLAPAG